MKAILRTNGAFLLNGSSYFEGSAIIIGQDGYAGPICGPWETTQVNVYKSHNTYLVIPFEQRTVLTKNSILLF